MALSDENDVDPISCMFQFHYLMKKNLKKKEENGGEWSRLRWGHHQLLN